ncbi:c6 zinc finger domain containing protein [Grosmannia clavigera kw1407]|uniref:C6 zinc finger domain containing protein n=1 Tax=Grosmannia clavigera (strain kw1407 / UAMH 11150) TaxID=655863 RepID=F0XA10_GROCL|nr:c6 zinc finger domain containing protein [Grosmannia clavigera kw1407]EFX05632.1 c6 zinc finger domain containing protein [Grosmannia clavigera kw1407]
MDRAGESRQSTASSAAPPGPRRALRKGTHSCGECKRRKTRCFFESPRAVKCVGCQRRDTACISQEYVDVPSQEVQKGSSVAESLGQVQQMLQQIMRKTAEEEQEQRKVVQDDQQQQQQQQQQHQTPLADVLQADNPYVDTCRRLHAALPSQEDVRVLFEAGRTPIYVQALCNPYEELFAEGKARSLEAMAELPAATAHPTILARKVLHVALCLQQLDPGFDAGAVQLGQPVGEAMRMLFSLATTTVTCHDELLDSLEGLECLVCEAVYLVNSGSLRRALLTLRRALTLAQLMGFHATRPTPWTLRRLDAATRVSSAVTWSHLAWLERFVALLLGLPTAITGGPTAPLQQPADQTASEWMERVQVDVCGRIMRRNEDLAQSRENKDLGSDAIYATTQQIDRELSAMAESLPAAWWSPLDFPADRVLDISDMMERMISAQIQIVHFTLVALLHLPYLLRQPTGPDGLHVCLSRGAHALRAVSGTPLVLLVAHLSGQRHADSGWLLPHHRRGDRAIMSKAVDTMVELSRLNDDELSRQTADLAQRLLDLEARSTKDSLCYSATATLADPLLADDSLLLQIPYFGSIRLVCEPTASPAYSDISSASFEHSYVSLPNLPAYVTHLPSYGQAFVSEPVDQPQPQSLRPLSFLCYDPVVPPIPGEGDPFGLDVDMPDLMAGTDVWAFQGVDGTIFENLMRGANYPPNHP